MYHAVLRFETRDGNPVVAISPYGSSGKDWRIGSRVRVTYDPADPRRAETLGFGPLWLFAVAFAFFAVISALAALSTLWSKA